MRKIKKANKKFRSGKKILFFVLLPLFAIGFTIYMLGQHFFFKSNAQVGNIIILQPNPETAKDSLQLQTFPFITIPPKPEDIPPPSNSSPVPPPKTPDLGNSCPLDYVKPANSSCSCMDTNAIACHVSTPSSSSIPQCTNGQIAFRLPPGSGDWYCITMGSPGMTDPNPPAPPPGCVAACIAKPVIYLYPTQKTSVDVSVTTPGTIFVSDPQYPQNGWKDIEAYPDGTFYYGGKRYQELFYESSIAKKIAMPETGILIQSEKLDSELQKITTQLGLRNNEQKEFLDYWLPVLHKMKSPYIYFSILPADVKKAYDDVTIYPTPDTRIEFIAYFKPLTEPINIKPLDLPQAPPIRKGFTIVEWGGTIGQ